MNIGISFGILTTDTNIVNNESIKHITFLYLLLKKIKEFNVYLINFGIDFDKLSAENQLYLSDLQIINWYNIKNKIKIDIFIESGIKINTEITKFLKLKGCKLIRYETENSYMIDSEEIIFKDNSKEIPTDNYDQIWILENNQKLNKSYLEELYKVPVLTMPILWDSYYIEKEKSILKHNNLLFDYVPHNKKDITIFESNDNINKMSFFPLIILEKSYNQNKTLFHEKIGMIRIMNSIKFSNNARFLSIVNKLNIKIDGFCAFEDKYNTSIILSQFTDIVVSTNFENSFNYLYLESLYGHYPLLHNSNIFKFNQYYYPEFNFQAASEKLIDIIQNHDKYPNDYNKRSNGIINNYSINNDYNINIYKDNILNLIN